MALTKVTERFERHVRLLAELHIVRGRASAVKIYKGARGQLRNGKLQTLDARNVFIVQQVVARNNPLPFSYLATYSLKNTCNWRTTKSSKIFKNLRIRCWRSRWHPSHRLSGGDEGRASH